MTWLIQTEHCIRASRCLGVRIPGSMSLRPMLIMPSIGSSENDMFIFFRNRKQKSPVIANRALCSGGIGGVE